MMELKITIVENNTAYLVAGSSLSAYKLDGV
jgi:hypothetical protein